MFSCVLSIRTFVFSIVCLSYGAEMSYLLFCTALVQYFDMQLCERCFFLHAIV